MSASGTAKQLIDFISLMNAEDIPAFVEKWTSGDDVSSFLDRDNKTFAEFCERSPDYAAHSETDPASPGEVPRVRRGERALWADRGDGRKAHYGSGRQPWDDIVEAGWGAPFAAANVLKYLRRTKAPEHSLESARWYWRKLNEMADGAEGVAHLYTGLCRARLLKLLTKEEHERLL